MRKLLANMGAGRGVEAYLGEARVSRYGFPCGNFPIQENEVRHREEKKAIGSRLPMTAFRMGKRFSGQRHDYLRNLPE